MLRLRVARGRHGTLDDDALPLIAEALNSADPDEVGAALMVSEGASFCTGGDVRAFAGAEDRGAYVGGARRGVPRHGHGHRDVRGAGRRGRTGLGGGRGDVGGVRGGHRGGGPLDPAAPRLPGHRVLAGRRHELDPAPAGGIGHARRILLTDEVLDAETAAALGIVATVVDDGDVLAEAERLAARLADGPTVALGRIKALLAASLDATLSEQLVAEERAIAASAAGSEGAEGLTAFVEKRPPKFR